MRRCTRICVVSSCVNTDSLGRFAEEQAERETNPGQIKNGACTCI